MDTKIQLPNEGELEIFGYTPPIHNYRYERKFTVPNNHPVKNLEYQIKQNSYLFREIYEQRQVNNIYFDTPKFQYYFDNVLGVSDRMKVRIRWYGSTFGQHEKPNLEIKIKRGVVGDKWTFPLIPFSLDNSCSEASLKEIFKSSNLPESIHELTKGLRPTLVNSYSRKYFLSANKKYRLTSDHNIFYRKIAKRFNHFRSQPVKNQHDVLELKYALSADKDADMVSNQFSFRMDKSSKYVNGIDSFNKFNNS